MVKAWRGPLVSASSLVQLKIMVPLLLLTLSYKYVVLHQNRQRLANCDERKEECHEPVAYNDESAARTVLSGD